MPKAHKRQQIFTLKYEKDQLSLNNMYKKIEITWEPSGANGQKLSQFPQQPINEGGYCFYIAWDSCPLEKGNCLKSLYSNRKKSIKLDHQSSILEKLKDQGLN